MSSFSARMLSLILFKSTEKVSGRLLRSFRSKGNSQYFPISVTICALISFQGWGERRIGNWASLASKDQFSHTSSSLPSFAPIISSERVKAPYRWQRPRIVLTKRERRWRRSSFSVAPYNIFLRESFGLWMRIDTSPSWSLRIITLGVFGSGQIDRSISRGICC